MKNKTEYEQMINSNSDSQQTVRLTLDAFTPLHQLAKANRLSFGAFCVKENKSRPLCATREYLELFGASSTGLVMASRAKKFILDGVRPNDHKEALLNCVGQAYLDVCLAISIADYCLEDLGNYITPKEYLSFCIQSINSCFDKMEYMKVLADIPAYEESNDSLKFLASMVKDIDKSRQIAVTRVKTAFDILNLWRNKKIKFDTEYEEFLSKIDLIKEQSEDEVFWFNAISALLNKEQFTSSEYDYINSSFKNRFDDEAVTEYKAKFGLKSEVTVDNVKAYFFKTNKGNTLAELI